jgi:hypothetical protein
MADIPPLTGPRPCRLATIFPQYHTMITGFSRYLGQLLTPGLLNFWWPSPAQPFLALVFSRSMTKMSALFYFWWPSPAQPFLALVFSRSMTKMSALSYSCPCWQMGLLLDEGRGRFFCARAVYCPIYPRYHGAQVTKDSASSLSLHCTKQHFARYTEGSIMQASATGYALTYLITLKLQLISWTIAGLTTAKFKPCV